jgi:hypothetical protein
VNAKPIYEPAGKPITQVNIDEGMLKFVVLFFYSENFQIYLKMISLGDGLVLMSATTLITDSMNLHGLYTQVNKILCGLNTAKRRLRRTTRRCLRT